MAKPNIIDHVTDNTSHIDYGIATGSANTYAVTLNPAPVSYVDGMALSVKINVQNTGASSINVNGLGAKTILKQNGGVLTSGNLKAGIPYTLRYNGTSFIVQGEGGEYGTAIASDVAVGKTIGTESGLVTGTLDINPVHGKQEYINPGSYSFTVPSKVTSIQYIVVGGGGGGGGGGYQNGGGGGGGGAWNISVLTVTPGQVFAITVGSGGTGGAGGSNSTGSAGTGWRGNAGNQSSFGSIIASGGNGGDPGGYDRTGSGGTGGSTGGGYGGQGGQGGSSYGGNGGPGGGIPNYGQGGRGGYSVDAGVAARNGAVILLW